MMRKTNSRFLKITNSSLLTLLLTSFCTSAFAGVISGEVHDLKTPSGKTEHCIILDKIPGGKYSDGDKEKEQRFCSSDLYSQDFAICPKTWSTSAALVVYKLEGTGQTRQQFEAKNCRQNNGFKALGKFKITMNQSGTSGTFSKSSMIYYHMSRLFNSTVDIPPAIYRTIDKKLVCSVAQRATGQSAMNRTAWKIILNACVNPDSYKPVDDIFTPDREQFFGTFYKGNGDRYNSEINSPRKAAWGAPQSVEFQTTAAYAALRSEKDLTQAIKAGEASARKIPVMNKDLGSQPISPVQMTYWMKELSEISIFDHIFSQQDRVGNIDFNWIWLWVDADGKVQNEKADISTLVREKALKTQAPAEIAAFKPILIQKTTIKDNDAGARAYANFALKASMVANLRHLNADTYATVINLAKDFKSNGPLMQYFKNTFDLRASELKRLTDNTLDVAQILQKNCSAGLIKFDVKPKKMLSQGSVTAETVDCANPQP